MKPLSELLAEALRESRVMSGGYCEEHRKCCGYHEGFEDALDIAEQVIAANPEATLAFLVEQGKLEQDKRPGLFGCPNVSDQSALCTCRPFFALSTSDSQRGTE